MVSTVEPRTENRLRIARPLLLGFLILAAGYISLLLWWELGVNPRGVPGLFHYPDATWGDGLLLPLLAVFLWMLNGSLEKTDRGWPTWLAGAVGGVGGAILIFTWWIDPHPSPNWTLPRPHDFTLAGEWHAAFLIAASAFFAGSWMELFRRIRASTADRVERALAAPTTVGALACTAGYAWLAASDATRSAHTASAQGSLAAVGVAAAALVSFLIWASHGALVQVARTSLAGLLTALALLLFVHTYSRTGWFMLMVALAGAVGAGIALAGAYGSKEYVAGPGTIAIPALFADLVLLAAHAKSLAVVILAPAAAIIFSIGLRHYYSKADPLHRAWLSISYLASSGISACLLCAGTFGLWLSAHRANAYVTAAFLLTILGVVLGGVFLPYYKEDYIELMRVEGDPAVRQPGLRPSSGQHKAAIQAWLRLGGYAVSATASMLALTVAFAPSLGWHTGAPHVPWRYPLGIALIGLIMSLPAAGALSQARKKHPDDGDPHIPRGGGKYVTFSFASAVVITGLGTAWLIADGEPNVLALVQSAFLVAFVALTMIDNGALLHAPRVEPRARFAITLSCSAVFIVVYWSLTSAIRTSVGITAAGVSFGVFMLTALFAVLLVLTTTCGTYVAGGRPYRTDYAPFWGAAQDCFLMFCMWFLLGWTPEVVLAHLPAGTHERWSAVGTILAGFLLLFGPAFLWVLENNDTHVERQRRIRRVKATDQLKELAAATSSTDRFKTLPRRITGLINSVRESRDNRDSELSQREFIIRLSGHTAGQNSVALLLAIISVIGIVGISSGLAPNAVGATGLLDEEILG